MYVGQGTSHLATSISDKHQLSTINMETLTGAGIVRKNDLVKILGTGELTAKLDITAHPCSATAKAAVEAAGGSITIL